VLAARASSLMLGVTTALTTDIAAVPLLWVAPLGLYLLTFHRGVRDRWRERGPARDRLPRVAAGLAGRPCCSRTLPLLPALLLHLVPFLAARHAVPRRVWRRTSVADASLTEFYFWLALGGMAGGLFNNPGAPLLFSRIVEYPLALAPRRFPAPAPIPARRRAVDRPVAAAGELAARAAVLFGPWTGRALPELVARWPPARASALMRRRQPLHAGARSSPRFL
jgi:hypothetical protein